MGSILSALIQIIAVLCLLPVILIGTGIGLSIFIKKKYPKKYAALLVVSLIILLIGIEGTTISLIGELNRTTDETITIPAGKNWSVDQTMFAGNVINVQFSSDYKIKKVYVAKITRSSCPDEYFYDEENVEPIAVVAQNTTKCSKKVEVPTDGKYRVIFDNSNNSYNITADVYIKFNNRTIDNDLFASIICLCSGVSIMVITMVIYNKKIHKKLSEINKVYQSEKQH